MPRTGPRLRMSPTLFRMPSVWHRANPSLLHSYRKKAGQAVVRRFCRVRFWFFGTRTRIALTFAITILALEGLYVAYSILFALSQTSAYRTNKRHFFVDSKMLSTSLRYQILLSRNETGVVTLSIDQPQNRIDYVTTIECARYRTKAYTPLPRTELKLIPVSAVVADEPKLPDVLLGNEILSARGLTEKR